MQISGRNIMGFVAMPQILPRCRGLFDEGFGFIAFSIACVLGNSKLLPPGHPYLNPQNIGRFGIHQVLAQAVMNLRPGRRNIDQIILLLLILVGCGLLIGQVGILFFSLAVHTAHAASPLPMSFAGFFESPDPTNDISFMVLDRIFGIPGLFGSCVDQNIACLNATVSDGPIPFSYQTGLQDLFAFYSGGLLFIAGIIFCYQMVTLVAEMNETGTIFGRRFNRSWAPLRLIAAVGLLIPVGSGLNSAQWITLYIAKFGSAFATNAWNFYLADITAPTTLLGAPEKLVSKPNYPSINDIIQFMSMAQTCWWAYGNYYTEPDNSDYIGAYVVRSTGVPTTVPLVDFLKPVGTKNINDMEKWFDYGDIDIVFGNWSDDWNTYKGSVRPFCGEVIIPVTHVSGPAVTAADGVNMDTLPYWYAYYLISLPWEDDSTPASTIPIAEKVVQTTLYHDANFTLPTRDDIKNLVSIYDNITKGFVDSAYIAATAAPATTDLWAYPAGQYGWAGAGLWYNYISRVNGAFADATTGVPIVVHYPEISEFIQNERIKHSASVSGENRFSPNLPPNKDASSGEKNTIVFDRKNDGDIAIALNQTYVLFNDLERDIIGEPSGNVAEDGINALFKKTGLWNLRDNAGIHPLAQMVGLGKGILVNAVTAFGSGTAAGLIGILGQKTALGPVAKAVSSIMLSISYIGIAAGILLYYVLPFMPFLYFFFAVIGWAKTVFECMIGIPLWALAHLRYDGQGLPTPQSIYGYYLLVDLFIRPVLIVFGLIASTTIFAALASTLNSIFNVVTSNLSGFNNQDAVAAPAGSIGSYTYQRHPIDALAFTIIYAVILYMVATGCFKMIDLFPNKIMRWMGSSAAGFGSMHQEDPGQHIGSRLSHGAQQVGGAAAGGAARMFHSPGSDG